MNNKSQIAVEYILVVGIFVLMVVTLLPYITKQNELNRALAAVRDGATYGAAMRSLGYKASSAESLPAGVIRISRVELVNLGTKSGKEAYGFVIHILAPESIKSNSSYRLRLGGTIRTQAYRQLYYVFNGEYPPSSFNWSFSTERFYFTCCNYTFD